MNPGWRDSMQGVPTLTEVLAIPDPAREGAAGRDLASPTMSTQEASSTPDVANAPLPATSEAPVRSAAADAGPLSADALTERILAAVESQVEQLFEYRLREVLTPILTRASDALVRDARQELSRSLRDIVSRSVAQELLRQRGR